MTKARTLASFVSTGSPFEDNTLVAADISDLTASVAELNIMDGVTASAAEMNYLAGVTTPIQAKLNTLVNVSLDGPAPGVIYANNPETFTITNYDILTTYTLSTTNGTVTRSGATITYTPATAGPGGFVVNGRSVTGYTVEVLPAPGEQAYTTAGTYSWVAPASVTSVSVVAVGGGGRQWVTGGGGGALAYTNNISVTPGNSYTVIVGAGGTGESGVSQDGGDSSFSTFCAAGGGKRPLGGTVITGTGFPGGNASNSGSGGGGGAGGGAGGYSGAGGNAATVFPANGAAGTGGAGGGGATNNTGGGQQQPYSGGLGGGVGIYGQGTSGAGGTTGVVNNTQAGSGGNTTNPSSTPVTPLYGGGGSGLGDGGGLGAVRIIWPGQTRRFPSTNAGNL